MASLEEWVEPDFHQVNLDIEAHLKNERGYKLDADDQICKDNLEPEGCPLGANCPLRHTTPSRANFQPPPPIPSHPRDREKVLTVCKHYLRGLCIMGKNCEFLHEYDLRRFPECWWWGTYGFCSAGDECLYYHPKVRKRECEDYNRGFCRLGPECPRKHIRRTMCPFYMAGFCPDGPQCTMGHPSPNLPSAQAYDPPTPPLQKDVGPPPPGYGRYHLYDPFNPAHWQVWAGVGGSSGGRFGGYNNNGGGGYNNAPQAIPSNIDEAARSAAVNLAHRMGLRDIPDDGGRAQGGNLWRYTAMVEKGLIKPPSEGGKGWKSADELRTVTCYRCGEKGHYATVCPNPAKPGDRGGLNRRRKWQEGDPPL
ncbi:hypothetical protein FFLO_06165 [Filobasidium floriforme]|uniref:mRNA 3'-end-processing protein n=1 Tax=Filobasidium floriforme TaxID=5210 RepID=A0A8K0NMF8_9TREE|nr:hypothetical protein FFLO_06165 [Filobasidium floriforme]